MFEESESPKMVSLRSPGLTCHTLQITLANFAIPDAYMDSAMFEESETPKLAFDQYLPRERRPPSPRPSPPIFCNYADI